MVMAWLFFWKIDGMAYCHPTFNRTVVVVAAKLTRNGKEIEWWKQSGKADEPQMGQITKLKRKHSGRLIVFAFPELFLGISHEKVVQKFYVKKLVQ
jgi:hypothetical protein